MPKRNTYSYLIEVLQHTIATQHENFMVTHCDLNKTDCEALEDAFADDSIHHVYKSAKFAYWELLDNGNISGTKKPASTG